MDPMAGLRAAMAAVDDYYRQRGIFQGRFGFGRRPALVVIDVAYGWTDPAYAGGSGRLGAAADALRRPAPRGRPGPPRRGDRRPAPAAAGRPGEGGAGLLHDVRARAAAVQVR